MAVRVFGGVFAGERAGGVFSFSTHTNQLFRQDRDSNGALRGEGLFVGFW